MTQNTHTIYPGTHPIVDKIIQDLLEQLELLNLNDDHEGSGKKNDVDYTGNSCLPSRGGKGGIYLYTLDKIYRYIYDIDKDIEERKKENKQRQKERTTQTEIQSKITYQIIPAADEVFAHWKSVLNHPKAKLDKKRKKLINDALKLFEVEELKKAIDGCRLSDFHMGENDRDTIYDAVSVIFGKGAEQIEKFIDLAEGGGDTYRPPYEQ